MTIRFKSHEWSEGVTKHLLAQMLYKHYQEFDIVEWTMDEAKYFLDLHPELYKEAYFREYHVRTIISILQEVAQ